MKKSIKIFTDFDGTISLDDLGDNLFKTFGTIQPYHEQLIAGELRIHDYWKAIFNELPSNISEDEIIKWINDQQIDPYFKKFTEWCNENEIELKIVSDGFDLYIRTLLEKNDLDVEFSSNKFLRNDDIFYPEFPGASESCSCFAASCKRNFILNNSNDNDVLVFIGDGRSDFCCAEHADIVFAKKLLSVYCNDKRIPHHPFKSFFDVKKQMEDYLKKGLKKRNIAKVNRKNAFESE